ncbi:MAG: lysylphosphatidylglycerol synthase transmembrane domain-containing protein, partial [archaeon]
LMHLISWSILLKLFTDTTNFFSLLESVMIGFLAERILPRVVPSGELTMGYIGYKKGITSLDSSIASVITQLFTWALGFILLSVIILPWVILSSSVEQWVLILFLVTFGMLLSLVMLLIYIIVYTEKARGLFEFFASLGVRIAKKLRFFDKISKKRLIQKSINFFNSFDKAITPYLSDKRRLFNSTIFMFLHHASTAAIFVFVVIGVGIRAPLSSIFFFLLVSRLVGWFSFMPGELGAFEVVSVILLSSVAPLSLSVLAVGIYRLIQYWIPLFIGSLFVVDYEIGKLSKKMKITKA